MVCADIPLTPPLSPKPDQSTVAIPSQELCDHQFIHPADDSQTSSQSMEVDRETIDEEQEPMSPPSPRRLLEDETMHLTRTGVKLSDFEVRGTLGSLLCRHVFHGIHFLHQVLGPLARFS
jgi:protein kinase A